MPVQQSPRIYNFDPANNPETLPCRRETFGYFEFEKCFPKLPGYDVVLKGFEPKKAEEELEEELDNNSVAPVLISGPVENVPPMKDNSWQSLLSSQVLKNIGAHSRSVKGKRYEKLGDLQYYIFSCISHGVPLLAVGERNTGKTTGYLIPLVNMLSKTPKSTIFNSPSAIIVTQSAAKARHVNNELSWISAGLNLSCRAVYEAKRLPGQRIDLLIAPVYIILDLINSGKVKVDSLRHLVIDEAERFKDATGEGEGQPPTASYGSLLVLLAAKLDSQIGHLKALICAENFACHQERFVILFHPSRDTCSLALKKPSSQAKGLKIHCLVEKGETLLERTDTLIDIIERIHSAPSYSENFSKILVVVDNSFINFIAARIENILQRGVSILDRFSDLVSVELSEVKWRTGECPIILAHRAQLDALEGGFIENIIIFESLGKLPLQRIVQKSANLLRRKIFIVHKKDQSPTRLIRLLTQYRQPIPADLWRMYGHD